MRFLGRYVSIYEVLEMSKALIGNAAIAGGIGLAIGVVFTIVVNLIKPTSNLSWSLIAVAFASFFSGSAGFIVGIKEKDKEAR